MGTLRITQIMLECDGCGAWYGWPSPFDNPAEARAVAYGDGWRYPHQVGTKGRSLGITSDVCPKCYPTWKPQPRTLRIRNLTRDEVLQHKQLEATEDVA